MTIRGKRQTKTDSAADLRGLGTEGVNYASTDLDTKSALEIAKIINAEDRRVPLAIESALPEIARAIDTVAAAFRRGGRVIYVGTGTSGRLGALDSAECPPTFGVDPKMVQFVIAGGDRALGHAVESEEDTPELGRRDLRKRRPTKNDVVIGLAASGRTPYTVAALEYAREKGCKTIAITANAGSALARTALIAIVVNVGPEVIAGSTRMKAATMQKLVCNMITTGAFTRIGYVYGNLMVNVHLGNRKLVERGIGIVQRVAGCDRQSAMDALELAEQSVPIALVMLKAGVTRREAKRRLKAAGGHVRQAIEQSNQALLPYKQN